MRSKVQLAIERHHRRDRTNYDDLIPTHSSRGRLGTPHGDSMRISTTKVLAVLTVILAFAAACGNQSKSENTSTTMANGGSSSLYAMLPDKIKEAGSITIGTDATYSPDEFVGEDGTTLQGMDIDMGRAIGEALGIKVNFKNAPYAELVQGLGSTYDIAISSLPDEVATEQAADFVTYYNAGFSLVVMKGQNQDLTSLSALCGKTVGVIEGSTEFNSITDQSTACTTSGQAAITIKAYPDESTVIAAVTNGEVPVIALASPVAGFQIQKSGGNLATIGDLYNAGPYGIAVSKDGAYAGMTDALVGALNQLHGSGKYLSVLTYWGVQVGAIDQFLINGAIF